MKMKLRKLVLLLLMVTVLAPVVTDTVGFYNNSTDNVNMKDVSISESSMKVKSGVADLENSNSKYSDALTGENVRISRQLTEELAEDGSTDSSTGSSRGSSDKVFLDENLIRQVTRAETGNDNLSKPESVQNIGNGGRQDEVKKESNSDHSLGATEDKSDNIEREHLRHSSSTSSKDASTEKLKARTQKHNEQMVLADARVRHLKDQLIRARVYLSLPSTQRNHQFLRELRLRMKEVQRALGDANNDSQLPKNAHARLKAMEQTLSKGKQIQDDCATVVKKLRAMLHSAEDQLRVHKKQALFLSHLAAKTVPKGLHCLPLRLSTDYFMLNSSQRHFLNKKKLDDPKLYHYALFSDNILAAAVVVNSTITHAKDPSKHVFHIVTDRINYAAMRMWFLANPPGKATIQVQNVEEFTWLNSSYSPVLRQLGSSSMIEYYFKGREAESDSNVKFRNPKYLSIMNHLRFYLPEIFPNLEKVLFLDDDIVVQKDLTGLWSIDMKGKVIGVVETCGKVFHRFDRYLNFSNPLISKHFDPRACGWAFGMNIFDLKEWRKQKVTEVYHKWQNLNQDRLLWKLGTLPPGLITFWRRTYTLDKSWHVLGLGYNPNVPHKDIERAAVIHYNGNLKPWLETGIPKFHDYWAKYLDGDQAYLRECNVSP